ncbi:MAG: dihydropteroate synthase [Bacteroidetes bacterium]|nr:MAG: dihydropteroate synthase [Bacteroidota bacterium]MBL1144754.1 dihydropteroate synthase [Bacteroidota bacterium]NOG57548.1 dihydropteroate synthase [Bacteroidota bacterium]
MLTQNESSLFQKNLSINLQGFLMDFSTAKVMGILNLTPDSFYDGGELNSLKSILNRVESMINEGADIIDVGAFSSRPGADQISQSEEINRLIPALKEIKKNFPSAIISVDTFRADVALQAFEMGASIINDISGGEFDKKLFEVVAKNKIPYLLMHMQGNPQSMQIKPNYQNVVTEIYSFLHQKIIQLRAMGVQDIIVDPGFGFGKNLNHNYQLLKELSHFKNLNCPILVGFSRKKMIQQLVDSNVKEALNGTTVANTIALMNGANILRVHDVKAAKEAISIVDFVQKQ